MPKPWARYEVGFIDHPKFQALTAYAIGLWLEGKNYCDKNMTDGLIPLRSARQFRFFGKKSVELLMASCGPKNEHERFAPLWEPHAAGFKMHDYLDHNDCHDEALARIDDAKDAAEIRKMANRKRQAEYRAKRKAELETLRQSVTQRNALVTRDCSTPTVPVPVTVPVPSTTERTAALPQHEPAEDPDPHDHYAVITAVVTKDILPLRLPDQELTRATMRRCDELEIEYAADVVRKAIDSALFRYYRKLRLENDLPPDPRGIYHDHVRTN